jgi:hypothetical protein
MNITHFLASTLLFLPQYPMPTHNPVLRNTFAVAAETVIDDADATVIKAPDAQFDPQMQQLKAAQANLKQMVAEQGEQEVVDETSNLIYTIAACHIQAKTAPDTSKCELTVSHARSSAMGALHKHKASGSWVEGDPS